MEISRINGNGRIGAFKERFLMDRKFKAIVIGGLILAVSAIIYFVNGSLSYVSTDDAFIEGHIVPISPKVAAHVVKVAVNDNQEVKAGDLLVELDANDYTVREKIAKADLQAAQAEAAQAQKDVVRYQALSASDEVSKQQLDHSQLQAQTADAKVASAQARLQQTELEVSYTKIFSPVSGHVTRKSVEEGAYVQTGEVLMAVVPEEKWVTANFKETQLTHMRPGQKVKIEIDSYPHKIFRAHVDSFQLGTGARFSLLPPENATGNFVKVVQRVPVKIVFDEPPDPKYPMALGMSVVPKVKVR